MVWEGGAAVDHETLYHKCHVEGIHISQENIHAKGRVTSTGFSLHRICSIIITHVTKTTLYFQKASPKGSSHSMNTFTVLTTW